MSSTMATADTDALNTFDSVLQSSDKTAQALVPLLDVLKDMSEHAQSIVSARFWIASRDEAWRIPLGESGVLSFFQSLIPTSTEPTLTLNALKIVGNSCAEKDANRKRVLDHPLSLTPIITALSDPETRLIAAVVLLNICNDYEPAQLAAIENQAVATIFNVLSEEDFDDDLDYFVRILELLLSHDSGKAAAPVSALKTLLTPLEAGDKEGFDNTLSLISILSSLLTTQRFQYVVAKESGLFSSLLEVIEYTYDLTVDAERESKDKSLIAYARNQLIEALGEIATEDMFLLVNPLDGHVMKFVRQWLEIQPGREELVVAACMVFGNVGRNDRVCATLVEMGIQTPLLKVIWTTAEKFEESVRRAREKKDEVQDGVQVEKVPTGAMSVGVIHAAVGVLKNLAIPLINKKPLADAGVFEAIRKMLEMEGVGVGQVWYSAVSLGRLAIVNVEVNAKQLLTSTPEKASLLSLFLKRYTEVDELPVKIEISRTIAALLRIIYAGSEPIQEILTALLSHSEVEEALWDMVRQEKYPVVRSEGWFALALLSRDREGARRILVGLEKEKDLAKQTITEAGREDRENAAVVCACVKQACGETEVVEELLKAVMEVQQREEGGS